MKKILFGAIFMLAGIGSWAQTQVSFEINHLLGDQPFKYELESSTNIGQDFKVTRLHYYISQIMLVHDGGQETPVPNTWILVHAADPMKKDLGSFPITELESISFHVGVEEASNHLDPASFPNGHPLAPQWPSMHWGWAAGYRFVAFEGFGGKSYNQLFQLHGLGDGNYFKTTVDIPRTATNGILDIVIDADYAKGLNDIHVNNGVIVHGESLEAKLTLENFRDHVFTAGEVATSNRELIRSDAFKVYPNPVAGEPIQIDLDLEDLTGVSVMVDDITGRSIWRSASLSNRQSVPLQDVPAGFYLVRLTRGNDVLAVRKLIVH